MADVTVLYNNRLGAGGFGVVYEGAFCGERVAVKVLRDPSNLSDLEKEIKIMQRSILCQKSQF